MTTFRRLLLALGLAVLCGGCSREGDAPASPTFEACRIKGIEIALRCLVVDVPEDRDHPEARHLAIHVAVIPALSRKPAADAIFVLAGGPGQAASDVGGAILPLFSKLNRNRDIVLVDQRGTGRSHPLSCADETADDSVDDTLDDLAQVARITRCATRLATTSDLTQYTTPIAMRDLEDVRARLGYRQIDLWGASYGTRAALEYARQFPDRVRTMVLDGVAPAWQKLPLSFGVDTHATLAALVEACMHDAACARRHPHLAADLDGLFARVAAGPIRVEVTQPVSGLRRPLTLTPTALAQLLRTPLYVGLTASLLPAAIERAANGDFDALGALGLTVAGGVEEHLALGMHLSVVCSEDMPAITAREADDARAEGAKSVVDGRRDPFATIYLDQYRRMCAVWPSRPVPAAYFETLAGKPGARIPTLLLSGGIDPATPPAHAASVARVLTDARHLIAPNVGHGVSLQGCAPDLIEKFVRSTDPAAIDGHCLATIPRPLFFTPIVEGRGAVDRTVVP